jgi:hypothetical protein
VNEKVPAVSFPERDCSIEAAARIDGTSRPKQSMAYLIGVVLAGAVCVFALLALFDREPGLLSDAVVSDRKHYVLFAVMWEFGSGAEGRVSRSERVSHAGPCRT